MLDRKILKMDYGVSYGSVALKSLQNEHVPELDLLVREAIQNSSDASLNEKDNSYSVNFTTGKFIPSKFNLVMTGIRGKLDEMFPEQEAMFLEIRDTQTSGLTGCIRKKDVDKDDHGNFFKLIYDTGKRQTLESAGGNWGFGKSVYYRVGIGIVIFYSRIRTDFGYENRLIITLIEDESKKDLDGKDSTILNFIEPQSAGRAWWGKKEGEDLLPIENDDEIDSLLNLFNVKKFKKQETGTSIIIPYINKEELLSEIIPVGAELSDNTKTQFLQFYTMSIEAYLKLSIQKWYAPKIHNRELVKLGGKKWLRVTVNNVPIRKKDMLPFFYLVQELYNSALAKIYKIDYDCEKYKQIVTNEIRVLNCFEKTMGTVAGYLSLIKISKDELNGDSNLLSPYEYIGQFGIGDSSNEPIVMYARDPGMIIEYAVSGDWVRNIASMESSNDFLFAFFVPKTNQKIRETYDVKEYAGKSLGEYLRNCEASDHMTWKDPAKMQIVKRIQKNSISAINRQLTKKNISNTEATASKLAGHLGKKLLPKIGYGRKKVPRGGGSGSGGSGFSRVRDVKFEITSQTIYGDKTEINFVLKLLHGKKEAKISLMIASEGGWIDACSWEKEIGTVFPVNFLECGIVNIRTSVLDLPYTIEEKCDIKQNIYDSNEIHIEMQPEADSTTFTKVRFKSYVINPEINGKIIIQTCDKKYQFNFRVE